MTSIFVVIAAYDDPDLAKTLDSMIRASSGRHPIRISVLEEGSWYADAYRLGRDLDEHVELKVGVGGDRFLGLGMARNMAESRYAGEDIQLQVDSHARFATDWDTTVVDLIERLGDDAIITSGSWADPWTDADKVPVAQFDRMENGMPYGHVELVAPESGRADEAYPARTVFCCAMFGYTWCDEVPADPHITFGGDEPTLAARLWTHGRSLWHARMPFYQAIPGEERLGTRSYQHPEWAARDQVSQRRVQALLTGTQLSEDDPAGVELEKYGLGPVHTLDEWLEYAGFDYVEQTVRTPWP